MDEIGDIIRDLYWGDKRNILLDLADEIIGYMEETERVIKKAKEALER